MLVDKPVHHLKIHKTEDRRNRKLLTLASRKESKREANKVYELDYRVMRDANILETFLNSLEGEIVSILPNVTSRHYEYSTVDFLPIVEKLS